MTFPTEADARDFIAWMMSQAEPDVVEAEPDMAVIPTTHGHWVITSVRQAEQAAQVCSICQEPFHEFSNNAQPVNGGRCCAYCDERVVTPARISANARISAPAE